MSSSRGLCSVAAVEGAVLDGFGDVLDGDVRLAAEVGDGAGDLEDAVVGAGAEARTREEFRRRAGCEIISKKTKSGKLQLSVDEISGLVISAKHDSELTHQARFAPG